MWSGHQPALRGRRTTAAPADAARSSVPSRIQRRAAPLVQVAAPRAADAATAGDGNGNGASKQAVVVTPIVAPDDFQVHGVGACVCQAPTCNGRAHAMQPTRAATPQTPRACHARATAGAAGAADPDQRAAPPGDRRRLPLHRLHQARVPGAARGAGSAAHGVGSAAVRAADTPRCCPGAPAPGLPPAPAAPLPAPPPAPRRPAAPQGPTGCANADLAWRREPDGYLKEILTARVYRIAIETPLQPAPMLSKAVGSEIMLKREDLQVGRAARGWRVARSGMADPPAVPLLQLFIVCGRAVQMRRGTAVVRKPKSADPSQSLPCAPPFHLPFPAPLGPAPQPVRSFKVRGAYNRMSRLTPEQLQRGVIATSAGNHAQVQRALTCRRWTGEGGSCLRLCAVDGGRGCQAARTH